MNKKILLFLLLIILFILLGLNTDFSSKSTSDKIINQKFGPEESSIINSSSLANIKIIDLEKSNENYLTYKRHPQKDSPIPNIDNITGIRGFDRNSVRKTEFFFGGETLYAVNHDLAKGCGLGDIKCSRQTLYHINSDNQAKPVFVAEKGLGTIDNILGSSYVYSDSVNRYVFDYKYYIDMRGNLFIVIAENTPSALRRG